MKRKMGLFGHICRMEDSRKIKGVMLELMDGKGRRGRPNSEWMDDIKEWGKQDLYSLTISERDRGLCKQMMKFALDTYGLSAHEGRGGASVESMPFDHRVVGSNPALATTKGPWASPSFTVDLCQAELHALLSIAVVGSASERLML